MKTIKFPGALLLVLFMLYPIISIVAQEHGQRGQRPSGDQLPKIGTITGSIIDDYTEEPLSFASVVLYSELDSTMVSGAIADEKGKFKITEIPPGRFYLSISFVGYPTQVVNSIRINFREPEYDAGIISIKASSSVLSEVTVEAARTLMEAGLDRRVINVGQELTAIGGTGLELMQNIPSVAVDFEGNVSLRGSTNVTILIDGRPATLTGLSGSEALEQIPSEMIERVEIITNPSVRYDPDGTSGIINVVLKAERRPGYNGMISLNASSANRYSGSINLNYKVKKINLFGSYSGRLFNSDGYGNSFRTSFLPNQQISYLNQDLDFLWGMNSHNAQFGIDYNINNYNQLTVSARYSIFNRLMDSHSEYSSYNDADIMNNMFIRDSDLDMLHNSMNYALNYKRTFQERHRELNTDIVFNTRTMKREEDFLQHYYENNFQSPTGDSLLENTRMDGSNWMFSLQTDYVHPLSESSKIETGFRGYIRELDTDFNFYNFDLTTGDWINNANFTNHFIYNEQVYALYGIYSRMIGLYSLQAGLRLEQSFINADLKTTNQIFSDDYFMYYPSMHIRRNFENNHSVQLSYSKRVNRPHNRNINPFVRYNSEYDISYGNPKLKPEDIHSFELGYTKFWETTTINPSIFYRNTQRMITRYRVLNEDGITETTFENLNKGLAYGAELIVSQTVAKFWRISGTFSYFRNVVQGGGAQMDMENDSYSYSARLINNITLPKGWNIQINGHYRSPIVMLQGEMDAMYSADIGVRKNLLNNNATITLRVSDLFNTQKFRMYNYGDYFELSSERKRTSRMLYVGFTYRINEYDRRRDRRRDPGDSMDNGGDMDFDDF